MKFVCPECKSGTLEEVMTGVTLSTVIKKVGTGDGFVDFEYDSERFSIDGGEVDRYKCLNCGFVVARDQDELIAFLKRTNC